MSDNYLEPSLKDGMYKQFDDFLAKSPAMKKLNSGDVIEGTVIAVNKNSVVLDIANKSEGVLPTRELAKPIEEYSIGDVLTVYVVHPEDSKDGSLVISEKRTANAGSWLGLEQIMQKGESLETTIMEANNGGVICEIAGGLRGFIPLTLLDPQRIYAGLGELVGKELQSKLQKRLVGLVGEKVTVKISELDREKNKIILSEKMYLQGRDALQKAETLKSIKEGDVLHGEVSSIVHYGIFVNAGGVEGLVHVSELSWDKVEDISTVYKVGDKVDVLVIGLLDGGRRVAYSVKRLLKDPWPLAVAKYKVGDIVEGVIVDIKKYGAKVKLGDSLNGLVHISEISDKLVKDPADYVSIGQEVKVKILSISATERHLGLSLKALNSRVSRNTKVTEDTVNTAIARELES